MPGIPLIKLIILLLLCYKSMMYDKNCFVKIYNAYDKHKVDFNQNRNMTTMCMLVFLLNTHAENVTPLIILDASWGMFYILILMLHFLAMNKI